MITKQYLQSKFLDALENLRMTVASHIEYTLFLT